MPTKSYFLKMGGAVLLGGITLIAAIVAVLALSPFIIPFVMLLLPFVTGVWITVAAVMIVWAGLFLLGSVGAFVYFFFRNPVKVNEHSRGYRMNAKESGRREKGKN